MTDNPVDVDISSLWSFAKAIEGEVEGNVVPNTTTLLSRLSGRSGSEFTMYDYIDASKNPQGLGANRTFGVDPRNATAYRIGQYHMDCERKAGELLTAFERGMRTIVEVARQIAGDYQSADELNNMDVARVGSYFKADSRQEPSQPQPRPAGSLADEVANQGGATPPHGAV